MGTTLLRWASENRGLLVFLALLALVFTTLRTKPSDVASAEALRTLLAQGQPTVLELYSNA
jgi:hypothetical protein